MKKAKCQVIFSLIIILCIELSVFIISALFGQNNIKETTENFAEEIMFKDLEKIYIIKGDEEESDEIEIENQFNNQTGKQKYYIKVNCLEQTVTIYEKDEEGYYSVPINAMICSTGDSTPNSGIYSMTSFKQKWLYLQGRVYGQYCTQIVGDILFHSVPYLEKNKPESLEYWEFDKLGQKASLGCVRLTVADAKWIYDNCDAGTKVEFYSSKDPGPLGKPVIEKISDKEELRNWDPTDEKENNPWKLYYEKKEKELQEIDIAKHVINAINEITNNMKIYE